MTMTDLEWTTVTRAGVRDLDKTLLHHTLENSRGANVMSPEDMKIAILAMSGMLKTQAELIDVLYEHLMTKSIETPWYKKLFKK